MIRHMLLAVLVTLILRTCIAQDLCYTPESKRGVCINLHKCDRAVALLQERPQKPNIHSYLWSLNCGFENKTPKICCEQQDTTTTIGSTPPTTVTNPLTIPDPPDVTNHPNLRLINADNCGPASIPKIIGGNKTGVFDFPWMTLLAYDNGKRSPLFNCGGTLINKRYVLTAAHCVTSLPSSN